MIVSVMAISNLVLTQQIYSEETNGAHAHNRDRVPWMVSFLILLRSLGFSDLTEVELASFKWVQFLAFLYVKFI